MTAASLAFPPSGTAACPHCRSPVEAAFRGHVWHIGSDGREFGYVRCGACGLVAASPMPEAAELTAFYATNFNYGLYSRRGWLKRLQGIHRWRQLREELTADVVGRPRLLDVGCGHGWFARAAARVGVDVVGLDLPSEATRFARERLGLEIVEGDFLQATQPEGSYDIISLWHALEHMRDPLAVLVRARALLKPGGRLVIAVPNVESRGLARIGAGWIWLQQPWVHLWHFSSPTLGSWLRRAGFTDIACRTHDTWDANYAYDAVIHPLCAQALARHTGNLAGRLARKLGGKMETGAQTGYFCVDESCRVLTYGAQQLGGLLRRAPADIGGSELLAIARNPLAASPPAA